MSYTDFQDRILSVQSDIAEAAAEAEGINLSPDQEAALAVLVTDFEELGNRLRRFLTDLLHEPG